MLFIICDLTEQAECCWRIRASSLTALSFKEVKPENVRNGKRELFYLNMHTTLLLWSDIDGTEIFSKDIV